MCCIHRNKISNSSSLLPMNRRELSDKLAVMSLGRIMLVQCQLFFFFFFFQETPCCVHLVNTVLISLYSFLRFCNGDVNNASLINLSYRSSFNVTYCSNLNINIFYSGIILYFQNHVSWHQCLSSKSEL